MSDAESEVRHRTRTKDNKETPPPPAPSRRTEEESPRSRNGILSPLWIAVIILGIVNGFLLFRFYQDKDKAIDNVNMEDAGAGPVSDIQKILDDVTRKYEAENEELKAEIEDLELVIAGIKNFYLKNDGKSELHLAAYWGDLEGVQILVEEGADLNGVNKKREIPLFRAATGPNKAAALEIIKFLIDSGADVSLTEYRGYTFLHELLETKPALAHTQFRDITDYLISKGLVKLFEFPDQIYRTTPLQVAVRELELQKVALTLLHENGVDFKVANELQFCLFYSAVEGRQSKEFLAFLVELGVDLKRRNVNNQTLICIASEFGHVEALEFFLETGEIDINAVDLVGNTALHHILYNPRELKNILPIAKLLIEYGADLAITNKHGKTPLDVVMKGENIPNKYELVELLSKNGH